MAWAVSTTQIGLGYQLRLSYTPLKTLTCYSYNAFILVFLCMGTLSHCATPVRISEASNWPCQAVSLSKRRIRALLAGVLKPVRQPTHGSMD